MGKPGQNNKPAAKPNLAAIKETVRVGGKGAPRRKMKGKTAATVSEADKKLTPVLKKLGGRQIPCDSVTMFKGDGAMVFKNPTMHAAINSNTFSVSGKYEVKTLDEMLPELLQQMGGGGLEKLAAQLAKMPRGDSAPGAAASDAAAAADDDAVPDLVPAEKSE